MARFRFSLESLLKLRRLEEDRARSAFLLRLRDFRVKETEVGEAVTRREEAKDRLRSLSGGALDIDEVLWRRRYINVLFAKIDELRRQLAALRVPLEEARAVHRQASTRRRAMEKLREKAYREFQREEGRREARLLDEAGQAKFLRARALNELEARERVASTRPAPSPGGSAAGEGTEP